MDTQIIGLAAGILTSASMLPQLFKIIREKEAEDVSFWMPLILLAGVGLWVVYGVLKKDLPIVLTNAFSVAVNLLLMYFRYKYKK